jgi:hypothetical protein
MRFASMSPCSEECWGLGTWSMYRKRKATGVPLCCFVFPDGLIHWWMGLDQNKHTSLLPFRAYVINTRDVFILSSSFHIIIQGWIFFTTIHWQAVLTFQFSRKQASTWICFTNPWARRVGVSSFQHQGVKWWHISLPKPNSNQSIRFQSLTTFYIGEKVHDSHWCVHSLHMGQKKLQEVCSILHLLTWHTILTTKK